MDRLAEHVTKAVRQLKYGDTIGRRGTPVISFWPMRPKWENWGLAWEVMGTDGDAFHENGNLIIPAVLQLAYFRCETNQVCQLAYALTTETRGTPCPEMDTIAALYDKARLSIPKQIH